MTDFTPIRAERRDKWQNRWHNFLAWFKTEDAYALVLLILAYFLAWLRG